MPVAALSDSVGTRAPIPTSAPFPTIGPTPDIAATRAAIDAVQRQKELEEAVTRSAIEVQQEAERYARSQEATRIASLPTATPTPTPTPIPTPTPTPVPTPTPIPVLGQDYFTRGSSQDVVQHVQGTPKEITVFYDEEKWCYGSYGLTCVTFSLPERLVTKWDNYDGALKVLLLPLTSEPTTEGYFTRGSSQDDVLHVQGTPKEIVTFYDEEKWCYGSYGLTCVTFSLPERLVTEWDNYDGTLKVLLLPSTSEPTTEGYFTRGSSQDDVLHVQGTPKGIVTFFDEEKWCYGSYGLTCVVFSLPERLVTEWDNYDGTLKVR